MKYNFKIKKEIIGFSASCIELNGCRTQADDLGQLRINAKEALDLFLSEDESSNLIFKKPKALNSKSVITIEVDPAVVLAMSLRQVRIKQGKTQFQMMQFLKIKNLSNYQRLENPKKTNPEFRTLIWLIKKLPELDLAKIINSYKIKA